MNTLSISAGRVAKHKYENASQILAFSASIPTEVSCSESHTFNHHLYHQSAFSSSPHPLSGSQPQPYEPAQDLHTFCQSALATGGPLTCQQFPLFQWSFPYHLGWTGTLGLLPGGSSSPPARHRRFAPNISKLLSPLISPCTQWKLSSKDFGESP